MNEYFKTENGLLYNCDTLELMKTLKDESIQLVVTSPPYFNLKEYGTEFNYWKTYDDYISDNKKWFAEFHRIVQPGGYVAWNIQESLPNVVNDSREELPLLIDVGKVGVDVGFIIDRIITWSKQTAAAVYFGSYPMPGVPLFMPVTEPIIIFRKKGKCQLDKEERIANKLEKDRWFEIAKNLWTIQPASAKQRGHDAPFPPEIPRRFIEIMTVPNSTVYDPFSGSGTTLEVAESLNRKWIGSEICEEYCDLCIENISKSTRYKKQENKREKWFGD